MVPGAMPVTAVLSQACLRSNGEDMAAKSGSHGTQIHSLVSKATRQFSSAMPPAY
jgi:hypothetical protein